MNQIRVDREHQSQKGASEGGWGGGLGKNMDRRGSKAVGTLCFFKKTT